ncbi:hypothetical protein WAI453_003879 [Rhynchosporium graminicola]
MKLTTLPEIEPAAQKANWGRSPTSRKTNQEISFNIKTSLPQIDRGSIRNLRTQVRSRSGIAKRKVALRIASRRVTETEYRIQDTGLHLPAYLRHSSALISILSIATRHTPTVTVLPFFQPCYKQRKEVLPEGEGESASESTSNPLKTLLKDPEGIALFAKRSRHSWQRKNVPSFKLSRQPRPIYQRLSRPSPSRQTPTRLISHISRQASAIQGLKMAGTGASSPFIKDEPEDQFFSSHNQRFTQQAYNIPQPQQHFHQFGNSHGGSINPNDLTMAGNGVPIPNGAYGSSYQNNYNNQASTSSFSKGIATFDDDELLESLGSNDMHSNQSGMQGNGYGIDFDYQANGIYNGHNGNSALSIDPNHIAGYSNTPDGDPIQSPFVSNFNHEQFRHMAPQHFGSPLHSGRKSSTRSPLTPKTTSNMAALQIGSADNSNLSQPIRTHSSHRHQKTLSGQWDQTPSSLASYPGSDFSPIQGVHPNPQISDILKGASMPTKLNNGHSVGSAPALQSQEMKRRRRRESHNLVERRRRDNINERIQELSHLVPMHRLEDEKVRKALQNNSPLSPSLVGISGPGMSPPQATSGLAGPGARRATAGNITTGIPIEEKDKGPNKGDILNGAVSWTRDLMWMLHTKLQQQEELAELIHSLGGTFPFQQTEDEKRMHTELMDAMVKNDGSKFEYSRAPGTGLRVPKHTDVRGDSVGSGQGGQLDNSLSPDNLSTGEAGMGGAGQYWSAHNSGGSGAGSISFKEEDEYGMDLTQ